MKRNQVNKIFDKDTKRRKKIISNLIVISIIFVFSFIFLMIYLKNSKVEYIKYKENSNVKYNVNLKNNEFYKDSTINQDNQYISELIDSINAEFQHTISLEKSNYIYNYSYRIEANAVVIENTTNKNIYEYNEVLLPKKEYTSNGKDTSINEFIKIDYNKYNNLISRFIQTYNLSETKNILKIDLIVDTENSCSNNNCSSHESVTSIEIPLTKRTVSIDTTNNLVNENENVMMFIKPSNTYIVYIVLAIILFVIDLLLSIRLIIYAINSRSAKTLYDRELKRILNNYRSYIQKINNDFTLTGYQVLKVDNFTDMLEIRDTTNQPILMIENGGKDGVYFVIPTSTKILYTYGIRVSDIEKKMIKDNI